MNKIWTQIRGISLVWFGWIERDVGSPWIRGKKKHWNENGRHFQLTQNPYAFKFEKRRESIHRSTRCTHARTYPKTVDLSRFIYTRNFCIPFFFSCANEKWLKHYLHFLVIRILLNTCVVRKLDVPAYNGIYFTSVQKESLGCEEPSLSLSFSRTMCAIRMPHMRSIVNCAKRWQIQAHVWNSPANGSD